jgi:hypothetical protein
MYKHYNDYRDVLFADIFSLIKVSVFGGTLGLKLGYIIVMEEKDPLITAIL